MGIPRGMVYSTEHIDMHSKNEQYVNMCVLWLESATLDGAFARVFVSVGRYIL